MTPATDGPIAACEDVTRRYGRGDRAGGVEALADVSLAISPGEVVGITGPSGSGKSTLLHLLAALDTPTAGRVELLGTDVTDRPERVRARLRRRHVGLVFQRFHLLPALSARANVALPLIEEGVDKRTRRERAAARLEAVGLGDRVTHRPGELSGGERQRVAVARALIADPALLLADEPTGELDTRTGRQVLDLLADCATAPGETGLDGPGTGDGRGRAVVLASHDEQALAAADRVVRLRDGRRVAATDDASKATARSGDGRDG